MGKIIQFTLAEKEEIQKAFNDRGNKRSLLEIARVLDPETTTPSRLRAIRAVLEELNLISPGDKYVLISKFKNTN